MPKTTPDRQRRAGGWRRRKLPVRDPNSHRMLQIALDAVSESAGSLYTLHTLRYDDGRERLVAYLGGWGRGLGPSVSHVVDLWTGEEFEVTDAMENVAARRLSVKNLPPPIRALWPTDDAGKRLPQGFDGSGAGVDKTMLLHLSCAPKDRPADSQPALF